MTGITRSRALYAKQLRQSMPPEPLRPACDMKTGDVAPCQDAYVLQAGRHEPCASSIPFGTRDRVTMLAARHGALLARPLHHIPACFGAMRG
jgi:hypothetical protein